MLDSDWIPQVAARGWLIITRDSMIIQNRNEIAAGPQARPAFQPADVNDVPADVNFEGPEKAVIDQNPPPRRTVKHAGRIGAVGSALTSDVSFL